MLTDRITEWLNGSRNFIVGRVLFNQLGTDDKIKELLIKGESAINRKILTDALKGLLKLPSVVTGKALNVVTDEMPNGTDTVLIALTNEWKPLYMRMNYLRSCLDKYGDSNSSEAIAYREPIALEVLQIEQKVNQLWSKRDHYLQHGVLPNMQEPDKNIPGDPLALGKHIESLKKNIRRNRSKMNHPGADAKFAQLYRQYCNEFKSLTGKDYDEKNKL